VRRTRGTAAVAVIFAILLLRPAASAQVGYVEQVMVLPVSVPAGRTDLSDRLTTELQSGVRLSSRQRLSTPEEVARQLGSRSVGRVLSGVSGLLEFSELGGTSFVIGGVANVLDDGRVEVSILLFSREEKAIHTVETAIFSGEDEAIAGIRILAHELTHPRNYAPADTSFFYSLILPGMGQLNQGEPLHAALGAGAVLAALLYGATIPHPNQFRLDWDSYQAIQIWGTDQYRFMIHKTEVSEEEFYIKLSADRKRNIRAIAQRREVEKRRRRASYLFVGAYLFNLVDTLVLTRRKVDTGPFFLQLKAVSTSIRAPGAPGLQLQLGIRFH